MSVQSIVKYQIHHAWFTATVPTLNVQVVSCAKQVVLETVPYVEEHQGLVISNEK